MKTKHACLTLLIALISCIAYAQNTDKIAVNKEFLEHLNTGNYSEACTYMSAELTRKKVTPEKLEKAWTRFSSRFGKLVDVDSTEITAAGEDIFVYTYARLEKGTAFLVTAFDKNDQVVGIHAYKKKLYKNKAPEKSPE